MEAEKNHHICKRSRVGNGNGNGGGQEEDEEDGGGGSRRTWHQHSSRIFRVSRASGGKDRHSKVYTAKGVRDRRVRLSVSTAIQFYDLQDRLGYDQPSKAIEWLIKAAAAAISELPTLDCSFPEPPNPRPVEAKLEIEYEVGPGNGSASETSKGSVPRSESRVKARERNAPHLNSQSSFTELLTGSSSLLTATAAAQVNPSPNCIQKQIKYLPVAATADYFPHVGFFSQVQKTHQQPLGFASQALEMQQFSFFQDNPVPVPLAVAGDYNLNFSISPCLAGFNRGTLQSNSPSQRFSSPIDGSNLPFFFGAAAHSAAAAENHFPAGLDGRLQLYYGDEHRRSDLEGKGKS